MPRIPPLLPDDAPDEVKHVYEDFSRKMRFPSPPNFIMTQGHSLTVVKGSWDVVKNVLVNGKIERWIKEMLFAAISKDRNCHYCEAAHIACCRMLGVNQSLLDDLVRDVNSISVPKVRDMILTFRQSSTRRNTMGRSASNLFRMTRYLVAGSCPYCKQY